MSVAKQRHAKVLRPLLASGRGQPLYGLLVQLNESQWWNAEQIEQAQLQQLKKLISHAMTYSPFYRQRYRALNVDEIDLALFKELPLLTRKQLQENNYSIDCAELPELHGGTTDSMTSSSTGSPVKFRTTALTSTLWNAINMREQLWHERQVDKKSASIRWRGDGVGLQPDGLQFDNWGVPVSLFHQTGPSYFLNSSTDVAAQLQWLQKVQPSYLMTHPSNLRALMKLQKTEGIELPDILEVRTVGESVSDELRNEVAELFNAKLVDLYSSEEFGYLAIQCPEYDHYHVQSESVMVEVLREDGGGCEIGEVGKLVISSLRNYATPLIRYEIGDYGGLGEPCGCGRGLPVLKRIHGRVRNMLLHPDGSAHWPNFGFRKFMKVADVRQFQVVQHTLDEVELKLVLEGHLSSAEEVAIKNILRESLGYPFNINISYHKSLARNAGGKFEDFVSLLA